MDALFTRSGKEVTAGVVIGEKGKASHSVRVGCARCGGAGRSDRWAHTGYTCFDCGGAGHRGYRDEPLYSAEKLAKLNATKAARDSKKLAETVARRQASEAQAEARRADFYAHHADLIHLASRYSERSEFIADVLNRGTARAEFTEGQEIALRNAIARIAGRDAQDAASDFMGAVGDRIEIEGDVVFCNAYPGTFGNFYIIGVRSGPHMVVYKGSKCIAGRGDHVSMKATIAQHETRDGVRQTIIARPKLAA